MICAEFAPVTQGGAQVLIASAVQPADLATCPVVLVTGDELAAVNGFGFPSPAEFGAAWAWGFSLVVASYVMAWGVGAVLRFLNMR